MMRGLPVARRRSGLSVALASVLLGALLVANCSKADDGLIWTEAGDKGMEAAESEARKTLPVFWAKFDAKEAGASHYLVKVALKTDDGNYEVLWAEPLSHTGAEVRARLANRPVYIAGLDLRSVVNVPLSQISDWSYERNGREYGHFTTRATMSMAKSEERAQAEAILAPTPLEPESK